VKHLCVEGWRFSPHSYAMVNQWQLLSIANRKSIKLTVRDVPYYQQHWRPTKGLFAIEQEKVLSSIPTCGINDRIDALYRIGFPYDFSVPESIRTVVFATSEYQHVDQRYFNRALDIQRLAASELFSVVTPSRWSREGFLRLGLRSEQVVVVPHGVDSHVFTRPTQQERSDLRKKLGVSGFTFANVSAMTDNKGIDLLIRGFAAVVEKRPDCRLMLKGTDSLYQSRDYVGRVISSLSPSAQRRVSDRIFYFGETISNEQMAQFYQVADAYVSPYLAEGFNLPVLEASACGTPVICTKGGPTDDFMRQNFAYFIDSERAGLNQQNGDTWLKPDLDHLILLMLKMIDDEEWREEASRAAADHAAVHFNWDLVVDALLSTIFRSSL
jgi:glycosyltransferase involved in cell wall biosynthesis